MILWRHSRKRTGRTASRRASRRERLHGADEGRRTRTRVQLRGHRRRYHGAGDTHSGVFLAELALGTAVIESARRGNAAAAMAISVLGPASCPERDVISSMIQHSP